MEKEKPKSFPYITVYVPHTIENVGPSIYRRTSLRRCWNGFSRLQKSCFISLLTMMLLFVVFVSFNSLAETTEKPEFIKQNSILNLNSRNEIVRTASLSPKFPHKLKFDSEDRTHGYRNLKHSSDLLNVVSTRAYESRIDQIKQREASRRKFLKAEEIRSSISLDPVISFGDLEENTVRKDDSRLQSQDPRQAEVVKAFLHAWKGYKTFAWGKDHLLPISETGQDWFGLGLTLIDSLDTMYIMGLFKEFEEAKDWVKNDLHFDKPKDVNLFETTIRVVAGLLTAFHLSEDQVFLEKAKQLGYILSVAFNTKSGVPYSDVNLRTKTAHGPSWSLDSTTSEVSTIQMEFRDLARLIKNQSLEDMAFNVSKVIHFQPKKQGLVPMYISPLTGLFQKNSVLTLGARADSYYEYLLKQWIQTGKTHDFLRDDYLTAMEGVRNLLLKRTPHSNYTFIGELDPSGFVVKPKMDHLVCYLPGTLALGVLHGLPSWHLEVAKELLLTCYQTYVQQPTGLAPEITHFNIYKPWDSDFYVKPSDAHNLLRPETVESLYYLYHITGDKTYQDWGWTIFKSFLKFTKVPHGFTSISNVLSAENPAPRDKMESFFLSETLKYFYLLFDDRDKPVFDLRKWVFNTEAHPFPVLSPH